MVVYDSVLEKHVPRTLRPSAESEDLLHPSALRMTTRSRKIGFPQLDIDPSRTSLTVRFFPPIHKSNSATG